jgi:hypothetical protein
MMIVLSISLRRRVQLRSARPHTRSPVDAADPAIGAGRRRRLLHVAHSARLRREADPFRARRVVRLQPTHDQRARRRARPQARRTMIKPHSESSIRSCSLSASSFHTSRTVIGGPPARAPRVMSIFHGK